MSSSSTLAMITTATALLAGVPATAAQSTGIVPSPTPSRTDTVLLKTRAKTEIQLSAQSDAGLDPIEALHEKALEFSALQEGWDGLGSVGPTRASLRAAQAFIDRLPGGLPLPGIMVTSQGEIGFYWDLHGGYADISFSPAGEGSFFARTTAGAEEFLDGIDAERLNRRWFFDRIGGMAAPQRKAA